MPYAAKNMFYDERWIDKQERGKTSYDLFYKVKVFTLLAK